MVKFNRKDPEKPNAHLAGAINAIQIQAASPATGRLNVKYIATNKKPTSNRSRIILALHRYRLLSPTTLILSSRQHQQVKINYLSRLILNFTYNVSKFP